MKKNPLLIIILILSFLTACYRPVTQLLPDITPLPSLPSTSQVVDSSKTSPTGFYWPTGEKPILLQNWLAHDCDDKGTYFDGKYHIGIDVDAEIGDTVYSISPGKVIHISSNGWGSTNKITNKGVIIQHYLQDGSPFLALYGHIQTNLSAQEEVRAGQQIGTVGDWPDYGIHLHFGIFPYGFKDATHLGTMTCPPNYSPNVRLEANGTEDPMDWFNTKYPGEIPLGASIQAPGGDGTDDWPTISSTIISATVAPGEIVKDECTLVQENAEYGRLGIYSMTFFVIGDSDVWKREISTEWPELAPKLPPEKFVHQGDMACSMKVFKEATFPPNNTLTKYDETIGDTQYHVEDYQYASPLHIKKYNRILVVSEDGNEQCFEDARQVLLCSQLVQFGPLELPSQFTPVGSTDDLATFRFGYNLEHMLTYDSNTWTEKLWGESLNTIDWPKSQLRDALEVLELNDLPGCTVHHSLGIGAPQTWTRSISQETIGTYNFRVEEWTDTSTNRVILVTYNIDEKNLNVAIEPGSETNSCLSAAREILDYSVKNDFGPIN